MDSHDIPPDTEVEKGWEGNLCVVTGNNNVEKKLPQYIVLHNNNVMRLRRYEAVVRRHKFKPDHCEHEFYLLLSSGNPEPTNTVFTFDCF